MGKRGNETKRKGKKGIQKKGRASGNIIHQKYKKEVALCSTYICIYVYIFFFASGVFIGCPVSPLLRFFCIFHYSIHNPQMSFSESFFLYLSPYLSISVYLCPSFCIFIHFSVHLRVSLYCIYLYLSIC